MTLKKVARTEQWVSGRKGARAGRAVIVASGPDHVVATSGVAAAWFDTSTGDAVFTTSEPAAADKARILRVGPVTYFRI